jgi:hypothetical protein
MRSLLFIFTILFSTLSFSAEVICYDGGKVIYRAHCSEASATEDGIFYFQQNKNTAVFTNATCVIKVKE